MKLKIEKANQVLHIVNLYFKTMEDASKFFKSLDSGKPVTLQYLTVSSNC